MKTWIKLYTEILSDPKMGRMSDKLFRRTIELFLLAGKEDKDGVLPSINDISWILHISEKEVKTVLQDLIKVGIVTRVSDDSGLDVCLISNFSTRQNSALDRSEINRRYYQKSKNKKSEIQTSESLTVRPDSDKAKSEIHTVEVEVEEEVEVEGDTEGDIKTAPAKPTKHKHGEFKHVLLTDEDLQKLQERFPTDYQQRIQNLDDYLENNPSKHYANHYLTILTWARKDEQKKPAQVRQPEPYKSTYQRLKEMGEI